MPSYILYSGVDDGYIQSTSIFYASARAGALLNVVDNLVFSRSAGQAFFPAVGPIPESYEVSEGALNFDGSIIPDDEIVTDAVISLHSGNAAIPSNFTGEVYAEAWGPTLLTTDFIPGSDLASRTLLASDNTAGWTLDAYQVFTSTPAFKDAINKTGLTGLFVTSDKQRLNIPPTGTGFMNIYWADDPGTSRAPRLVVQTTPAPQNTVQIGIDVPFQSALLNISDPNSTQLEATIAVPFQGALLNITNTEPPDLEATLSFIKGGPAVDVGNMTGDAIAFSSRLGEIGEFF